MHLWSICQENKKKILANLGLQKVYLNQLKSKHTDNKFCRAKDNRFKSDIHNKFKKYRNLISTLSRKSKNSYFLSFFKENKKKKWSSNMAKNKWIKTKPTKRPQPKSLHINKRIETNNLKITSRFNSFFNTIAGKIDERIISTSFAFRTTLREPTENTMFL